MHMHSGWYKAAAQVGHTYAIHVESLHLNCFTCDDIGAGGLYVSSLCCVLVFNVDNWPFVMALAKIALIGVK